MVQTPQAGDKFSLYDKELLTYFGVISSICEWKQLCCVPEQAHLYTVVIFLYKKVVDV